MKRTFRKFRAVIRRSSLTKGLITFLLTGAGILSFLVMAGESDPDTMPTIEALTVKAYAAVVMIIDVILFKIAYRNRLLTNEVYRELKADKAAIKQED